jgi:hypothetical protein
MGPQDRSSHPGLEAWLVGALRLTAYTDPLATPDTRAKGKRWEGLVGTAPENVISRMFGMEQEENGPFPGGGKLSYKWSLRGTEWFLESVPDPNKPETFFGMSTAMMLRFKELVRRWLVDCPPLQRLAFGAALYLPVKDRREAYHQLEGFLHLGLKYSDDEGDFLYQYNRRRRSNIVPNLKINRLSKWTWLQLGLRASEGDALWPLNYSACLLELDINTALDFRQPPSGESHVPMRGPLPPESYVPLFDELVAFAEEIAAKGDVS